MSGHKEQNTVLLTLEYPPQLGGIATYLAYFAERFPAGNMTVLAPPHDGAAEFDAQSSVPIERRPLSAGWLRPRWLPALYWAWRTCRRTQADVLVVSHLSNMGRVALWLRRLLGLPYVVVLHGMDIALAVSGRPGKRAAAKKILAQADQIVCNSEYTSRWVSSVGLATDNVAVVNPPPSVPLESTVDAALVSQFRDRLNLGDSFVLLSTGRLVERKGFDRCLQAVAALRDNQRDIQYVIVGEGPDRDRLEGLARELGVPERVHFLGAVSAADLAVAYAACDVFAMVPRALGSDVEGFGIVYLEANAFGKPVIGSRSGGVPEAVKHEQTGLLVEPDDVAGLQEAIARLMDDAELCERLAVGARQRLQEDYGDDRQARRFIAAVRRASK